MARKNFSLHAPLIDTDIRRLQSNWSKQEHAALLVDKSRRAYYKKTNKHLKETVLKTDAVNVPLPAREQDLDLQRESPRPMSACLSSRPVSTTVLTSVSQIATAALSPSFDHSSNTVLVPSYSAAVVS